MEEFRVGREREEKGRRKGGEREEKGKRKGGEREEKGKRKGGEREEKRKRKGGEREEKGRGVCVWRVRSGGGQWRMGTRQDVVSNFLPFHSLQLSLARK